MILSGTMLAVREGRPDLVLPAIVLSVGLHLLPLARAFGYPPQPHHRLDDLRSDLVSLALLPAQLDLLPGTMRNDLSEATGENGRFQPDGSRTHRGPERVVAEQRRFCAAQRDFAPNRVQTSAPTGIRASGPFGIGPNGLRTEGAHPG